MKRVLLSAFFLGISVNVFGQVKSLTKEQYDLAHNNAYKKVSELLRRVVTETISYKGNNVDSIATLTIETFPNGDERWNSTTKKDAQIINKLQSIYLGKYEYRKEGDTDWKKRCVKDCSKDDLALGGTMRFGDFTELPKVQEYLVSETTLQDKPATVYVLYSVYQLGPVLNFLDSKMWIGSDGLIIREETIASDIFPTIRRSLERKVYEYNPKDVAPLEAPIK